MRGRTPAEYKLEARDRVELQQLLGEGGSLAEFSPDLLAPFCPGLQYVETRTKRGLN